MKILKLLTLFILTLTKTLPNSSSSLCTNLYSRYAKDYNRQAAQLFLSGEEQNHLYLKAESLKNAADCYRAAGDEVLAATNYKSAAEKWFNTAAKREVCSEKAQYFKKAAECYHCLSKLKQDNNESKGKAIGCYQIAAQEWLILAENIGAVAVEYSLFLKAEYSKKAAECYLLAGTKELAIRYFKVAAEKWLDFAKEEKPQCFQSAAECYQSLLLLEQGNDEWKEKFIEYYDKAADKYLRYEGQKSFFMDFKAVAECYALAGKKEKAFQCYKIAAEKWLDFANSEVVTLKKAEYFKAAAECYNLAGTKELAFQYYKIAAEKWLDFANSEVVNPKKAECFKAAAECYNELSRECYNELSRLPQPSFLLNNSIMFCSGIPVVAVLLVKGLPLILKNVKACGRRLLQNVSRN